MSQPRVTPQIDPAERVRAHLKDTLELFVVADWCGGPSKEAQTRERLKEFEPVFEASCRQIEALIGQPEVSTTVDGFPLEKWWPQALQARVWIRDSKILSLGLVQFDEEGLVAVLSWSFDTTEIAFLAAVGEAQPKGAAGQGMNEVCGPPPVERFWFPGDL